MAEDGASEAWLLAHAVTVAQMVALVRDGLASLSTERVVESGKITEIARLRITPEGRRALAAGKK